MAPEGQDNLKGQACLGCKRNDFQEGGHVTSHLECILTRLLASHPESAFLR
jgi:hypothetical protein